MEQRFKPRGFKWLAVCGFSASLLFFTAPKVFASQGSNGKAARPFNENTAASLEMIAERMKSLSESLAAIPELPRLDQVIQIPEGFEKSNTEKEMKK